MINSVYDACGALVMFVGTEAYRWNTGYIMQAARNAKAMGCDGLVIKRYDGQIKWYGTPARLKSEQKAVESIGMRYIPFGYEYGFRISREQPAGEAAVVREVLDTCGIACIDMEAEYNGQVEAAQELANGLKGHKGYLIVSTWADPDLQSWQAVTKELEPVVDAWGPQQYNNWLFAQEHTLDALGERNLMPELDLTSDFGPNNPFALVQQALARGHKSIWLWEYQTAMRNPNLVRSIAALIHKPHENAAPVKVPHPIVRKSERYTVMVERDDTLYKIAARISTMHHIAFNWFHDLYLPNRALLDAVARAHHASNSDGGNLIFAGTLLPYYIHN